MKPKSFNRDMRRELAGTLAAHGVAAGIACVASASAWDYARWWTASLISGLSALLRLPAGDPGSEPAHVFRNPLEAAADAAASGKAGELLAALALVAASILVLGLISWGRSWARLHDGTFAGDRAPTRTHGDAWLESRPSRVARRCPPWDGKAAAEGLVAAGCIGGGIAMVPAVHCLIRAGSGAGKTRFYAKPNLCQANTSFTVLDPKGELLRSTGHLLRQKGYEVRVLDLLNMEKSHCYNPFVYLRDDNDVQRLVTNLFKSTTPKGSQSNDPFWDTAASMLLLALIFYLKYEAPPDEQNFPMVMEMLRAADVREDCDEYTSPLDELFERLEMREPDHIAVKYYKDYHSGSAKTLKSIQITLAARLEKFNLSSLAALTATDELDLPSLGEKKVALFALIPDNDTSFNFLVSILYTQLFQQLFYLADHKYGGSLPVPVHFLMDEFSNVSLPDDFSKILAVMRSRNVYVSIILQNVAALKALFEKEWESILGNCDEFLYLGGNETSTHKLISESYLGKSTIDTNTYGKSSGRNGNYSTNYQISGRELLTPDEVRMLDNRYALLFIRGERPVMDEKYDILKHPNIALTEDGGAAPYEHGGTENAVATLSFAGAAAETVPAPNEPIPDYELLSDEDIEALF